MKGPDVSQVRSKSIIIYLSWSMGYFLTRSGLTYPEVSSKIYHDASASWEVVFHYPV